MCAGRGALRRNRGGSSAGCGPQKGCTHRLCEVLALELQRASTSGGGKIWLADQEEQHEKEKDIGGPVLSRWKEKGRREERRERTESLPRGMVTSDSCFCNDYSGCWIETVSGQVGKTVKRLERKM